MVYVFLQICTKYHTINGVKIFVNYVDKPAINGARRNIAGDIHNIVTFAEINNLRRQKRDIVKYSYV